MLARLRSLCGRGAPTHMRGALLPAIRPKHSSSDAAGGDVPGPSKAANNAANNTANSGQNGPGATPLASLDTHTQERQLEEKRKRARVALEDSRIDTYLRRDDMSFKHMRNIGAMTALDEKHPALDLAGAEERELQRILAADGVGQGESAQDQSRIAMNRQARESGIRSPDGLYVSTVFLGFPSFRGSTGKIRTASVVVIVGDGRGMLGLGEGRGQLVRAAKERAKIQAMRNMRPVALLRNRTIWGSIRENFAKTTLVMMPRAPGFGIRASPVVERIAEAAGVRDLSAKIIGRRNNRRIAKLAVSMLQDTAVPVDMNDGFGRKGPKRNKMTHGQGMRSALEVGAARGRLALDSSWRRKIALA